MKTTSKTFDRISLFAFALSLAALFGCASGSQIVTGQTRTPTFPDAVKLYTKEPAKYEVIALVKASSDAGWTQQGDQDYAIRELKKRAAKLGANGVLIKSVGEKTSGVIGNTSGGFFNANTVSEQVVEGQAIFVTQE